MRLDQLHVRQTVTVALGIEWAANGPIVEDLHTGERLSGDRNWLFEEHGREGQTRDYVRNSPSGLVVVRAPWPRPAEDST